jgi:hypothetical protein
LSISVVAADEWCHPIIISSPDHIILAEASPGGVDPLFDVLHAAETPHGRHDLPLVRTKCSPFLSLDVDLTYRTLLCVCSAAASVPPCLAHVLPPATIGGPDGREPSFSGSQALHDGLDRLHHPAVCDVIF